MISALFLDVPNIITINSKNYFPLHREDWRLKKDVNKIIKKHIDFGHKIILVGNFPNIPISKKDINPVVNLFVNIAETIEKDFKLNPNTIAYDYATDVESYDYLPSPGLLYNMALEYEIILPLSFILTTPTLGKFIQHYSGVKGLITDIITDKNNH